MTTLNDRPVPFITIWAEEGIVSKTIPELQADRETTKDENGKPLNSARATMQEGFPAITMKSAMRGGVPPWGQDHNKILNQITDAIRWMQAGGCAFFNQTLCSKIIGYPKGAMLQGKKDGEVPILWFSVIDNNNSDPDVTISPNNGWVKLDFADLEKRLKAAEDHIVIIDGRLDNHDIHLGTIDGRLDGHDNKINTNQSNISKNTNDITILHETKAELEGSCITPFKADTMSAKKYNFGCQLNDKQKANSYLTEDDGILRIYTDSTFRVFIKDDNKDKYLFSIEENFTTLKGFYAINLETGPDGAVVTNSNIIMNNGKQFIHENVDNSKAWFYDVHDKDYVIGCYPDGYHTEENTMTEVLKISQVNDQGQSYNIYASAGAFVNGPKSDLAEYYQADHTSYEPGTLMCHGTSSEVTLCKNYEQADDFFGIISTDPAYIMNGNAEKDPNAVLIALNGKVPVKVKGVVRCGDKITVGQNGYGVVSKNKNDVIVGRAKEDKITEVVGLVSCYVQAHI